MRFVDFLEDVVVGFGLRVEQGLIEWMTREGREGGRRRRRVCSTLSESRLDLLEPNLGSRFGLPLGSVLEPKPTPSASIASHIASSGFVSPSLYKGLKGKLFGGYGERAGSRRSLIERRFLVERLERRFLMRHIL